MDKESVCEIVREMEMVYVNGNTNISKYVTFNQYENIAKIDAYLNSKHVSGEVDSLGREKPFFNIVTGATNIWYRATDIDRKNIKIKATTAEDYIVAFIASLWLQDWMKRNNFGLFLNEWGRTLARYGSAVVKFVEKGKDLIAEVVNWNSIICDTVDFDNNVRIEKIYLTPAQLRKNKSYNQDAVKDLIEATSTRKTLGKQQIDVKADYIELYEVHGEMPLELLTDDEKDSDVYVQQMHVVSYVGKKGNKRKGSTEYEDFTLYRGKEDKNPTMITHLIKENDRTQGIGAVEYLFEAQWMQNHSIKQMKDQLDLASKLIFQTQDASFVGKNALSAIENGDILVHEANSPLTQVANNSHDITAIISFADKWRVLSQELTSTPDSIQGQNPPSGTAYRTVMIQNQEAHSLFEIMTENKGLYIEKMLREYVIPFIRKQLKNSKEISAILDEAGVAKLDSAYIPNEAIRRSNKKIKDALLSGDIAGISPETQAMDISNETKNLQDAMSSMGNQRFIKPSEISSKTWAKLFKDLEWEVEVEVTGENSDKAAVMQTLTTVLQTIAQNPNILQDPNMKMLFNKILEATGEISPIELTVPQAQQPPQPNPQAPAAPEPNLKSSPTAQPY